MSASRFALPVLIVSLVGVAGASAAGASDALAEAMQAYAKVNDYTDDIAVHEVSGKVAEDRTYRCSFLRPSYVKVEVTSGPGRGSGAVWTGGDKVSGHQGGFLSGIHVKVGRHDKRALSLRGATIDSGTLGAMLDQFAQTKGTVTKTEAKIIDGQLADAFALKPADPQALGGVTRVELDISRTTNLPIRRAEYVDEQLVKSEDVTNLKTNVGLTVADFPF